MKNSTVDTKIKTTRKTVKKVKKGFTLVELLFVMAIIAILAGIGLTQMSGSTDTATNTAAKAELRNLITKAQEFKINFGTYMGFDGEASFENSDYYITSTADDTSFCIQVKGAGTTTFKYDSTTDSSVVEGTCSSGNMLLG